MSPLVPILVSAALLPVTFAMLWRRRSPQAAPDAPEALPELSVVIPARDEAESLPKLLADLAAQQTKPGEILVVDDGSSDATASLARSGGATVLSIGPGDKPAGWNGKSWACHVGVARAKGGLILLLDADVRLSPDALGALHREWKARGGALCVQPWHEPASWREELSAALNVLVLTGTNAFTPRGERWAPSGAFGPCILISKSDHHLSGGHEAVRLGILDNLPFGRNIVAAGIRLTAMQGASRIRYRMYPGGWAQQNQGWSKSLATGASTSHPIMSLLVGLWITGAFCSLGGLAQALHGGAMVPAAAACVLGWVLALHRQFRIAGRFSILTAFLFPIPFFYLLWMQVHSLYMLRIRKRVAWRGRVMPAG